MRQNIFMRNAKKSLGFEMVYFKSTNIAKWNLVTLLVSHTESVTDITDVTAIIAANFQ